MVVVVVVVSPYNSCLIEGYRPEIRGAKSVEMV